jgi:hypothetical protein
MHSGFPVPRDDDPEDVAWALTTGSALWKQGEHRDALVWLRRALDAAADAERWARASELEAAATELDAEAKDAHGAATVVPGELPPPSLPPVRRPGRAVRAQSEAPAVDVAFSEPPQVLAAFSSSPPIRSPASAPAPEIAIAEDDDEALAFDNRMIAPLSGEAPALLPPPAAPILAALEADTPGDDGPPHAAHSPSATLLAMVEAVLAEGPGAEADDQPPDAGERLIEQVASSVSKIPIAPAEKPISVPAHAYADEAPAIEPEPPTEGRPRERRPASASAPPPKPASVTPIPMPAAASAPPPKPPTITSRPPAPEPEPEGEIELPLAPTADEPEPALEPALPFSLEGVVELEALSDEQRVDVISLARLDTLGPDEEVRVTGLVLIVQGSATVQAELTDVPALRVSQGNVVYAKGSLADTMAIRIVGGSEPVRVAIWELDLIERTLGQYPGLLDELQQASDRTQALAGATMGPIGERLDEALRAVAVERLQVRVLEPGEQFATKGNPVAGIAVVGTGGLDLVDEGTIVEHLGPGDFLFASEVLAAAPAPADAVASAKGALILYGKQTLAKDLLVSCPPLLDVFAGS